MRRSAFLLVVLVVSFSANSQVWFDLGLRGGGGLSFLMNKDFSKSTTLEYRMSPGWYGSARFGVNFGEKNGVVIEPGYHGYFQNYIEKDPNGLVEDLKHTIKRNFFGLGLQYRLMTESSFFELGPSIFFTQSGSEEFQDRSAWPMTNSKMNYGVDLGVGGYMAGGEKFSLIFVLRGHYSFTGALENDFSANAYSHLPQQANLNPFMISVGLELNFNMGYLVRSSCGNRTHWMSF